MEILHIICLIFPLIVTAHASKCFPGSTLKTCQSIDDGPLECEDKVCNDSGIWEVTNPGESQALLDATYIHKDCFPNTVRKHCSQVDDEPMKCLVRVCTKDGVWGPAEPVEAYWWECIPGSLTKSCEKDKNGKVTCVQRLCNFHGKWEVVVRDFASYLLSGCIPGSFVKECFMEDGIFVCLTKVCGRGGYWLTESKEVFGCEGVDEANAYLMNKCRL